VNTQVHTEGSAWGKDNYSFLITHLILTKETYHLSTSECTCSHSSKRKRATIHFYSYKSCVKMLTRNESNLPAEHKQIHKSTSSKSRKGQPFILNHTSYAQILTKYESNAPPEHKWMHKFTSSKWRKEQPFILNHTSCFRMLTKYQSNLPSEHKWMHKFTQQVEEEKTAYVVK